MVKFGPKPKSAEERFKSKFTVIEDCWVWHGNKNNNGYGLFMLKSPTKELAHRVAWKLFRGDIPKGINVLHKCDNPACVNPEHLFLGSQKDNMQDMSNKGRNGYTINVGSNNGQAKLTEEQVKEIRKEFSTRKTTQRYLAEKYNVSMGTISNILTRKYWNEYPKDYLIIKRKKHQSVTLTKLNEDKAREIRNLYASKKYNYKDLADKFNVTTTAISRIIRGIDYSLAGGPINLKRKQNVTKLTESQVREMKQLYKQDNISLRKLAKQFNVSYSIVQQIMSGVAWKHVN